MFYKLIRLLVLLSAIVSLGMLLGMAMGYLEFTSAPLAFQSLIVATSLFLFYQSRAAMSKNSLHKMLNLVVHLTVIPLGIVGALCVTSQSLAVNYWFLVNMLFVVFLTLTLINIIAASGIKKGLKLAVIGAALAFATIVLLQMSGQFNHGKIVLFGALVLTLLAIVAVIAAPGKKRQSSS
ncbi:MAG TPA: hypothetical protein VD905_02310 [Flavobacteriales bacterium]|nr:hypothetical protein [Flavobacteriales bacterium]